MDRDRRLDLKTRVMAWLRRGQRPEADRSPVALPRTVPTAVPAMEPTPARRLAARLLHDHVLLPGPSAAPWLLLPRQRNYRLYIPSRASDAAPLPLVVMIHGCRQDAEVFARGTRMDALAEAQGFAVLYPEQAQLANVRRCWSWFEAKTASGAGECELVLEMIREATRKAAIADREVFVAGLSSGGALAALLAFHHPQRFRAVAVHSGLPPVWPISATQALTIMKHGPGEHAAAMAARYWGQQATRRAPVRPPPLLVLHGDADARVSEVNAGALVTLWRTIHETAPASPRAAIDKATEIHAARDGARAFTQTDYMMDGRLILRGIRVHGLAHAWSGGDAAEAFFDPLGPVAAESLLAFLSDIAGRTIARSVSE